MKNNESYDNQDIDALIRQIREPFADASILPTGLLSEFARSEMTYRGSIMYGYAAIKRNDQDLLGQLREVYSHNIVYTDPHSNASLLQISSPADKSTLQYDNIYLIGASDPAYPVYLNNKKISRTKSGYFSLYVPLNEGENVFTFVHNSFTSHNLQKFNSDEFVNALFTTEQ